MSLPDQNVAPQSIAVFGQKVFAFAWRCDDPATVVVWVDDIQDGGFAVALNPDQTAVPGGSITRAVACLGGEVVTVERASPKTQITNLVRYGPFPADTVTTMLDRAVMLLQEVAARAERAIRIRRSSLIKMSTFDFPVPEVGKVPTWVDAGGGLFKLGNVLQAPQGPPGPAGAPGVGTGASRVYPPDANDILRYSLDETVSPWANTGSGGAADLIQISGVGSLVTRPGLYPGAGTSLGRGITFRGVAQDRAQGGAGIEPVLPVTVSCWWFHKAVSNSEMMFGKYYRPDGTWANPFVAMCLNCEPLNAFSWNITTGAGALLGTTSSPLDAAIVGSWNLIVGTYDGVTMKLYVNGQLSNSIAKVNAIDYGTHGPWSIGASPPSAGQKTGVLDECRVANVLRDNTWVENYWKSVMLLSS
jgi:hypothetical protein